MLEAKVEQISHDMGDMSQRQHCAGCDAYAIPEIVSEIPSSDDSIYICPDCAGDEKRMRDISRKYNLGWNFDREENGSG